MRKPRSDGPADERAVLSVSGDDAQAERRRVGTGSSNVESQHGRVTLDGSKSKSQRVDALTRIEEQKRINSASMTQRYHAETYVGVRPSTGVNQRLAVVGREPVVDEAELKTTTWMSVDESGVLRRAEETDRHDIAANADTGGTQSAEVEVRLDVENQGVVKADRVLDADCKIPTVVSVVRWRRQEAREDARRSDPQRLRRVEKTPVPPRPSEMVCVRQPAPRMLFTAACAAEAQVWVLPEAAGRDEQGKNG